MEREAAYRRKFNAMTEELESLPADVTALNSMERKGVLHVVQVAIDAAMDLAAMAVKDTGRDVVDDYHNLEALAEAGVIDGDLASRLRRLNGLRNAIVHKYNRFEESAVLDHLDDIQEALYAFAERLEARL